MKKNMEEPRHFLTWPLILLWTIAGVLMLLKLYLGFLWQVPNATVRLNIGDSSSIELYGTLKRGFPLQNYILVQENGMKYSLHDDQFFLMSNQNRGDTP
jgi:hypothetical protein